jgi:hypothetical protein
MSNSMFCIRQLVDKTFSTFNCIFS